jgi:hypothetical protein
VLCPDDPAPLVEPSVVLRVFGMGKTDDEDGTAEERRAAELSCAADGFSERDTFGAVIWLLRSR